jgi:hypothetical protein
MYSPKQAMLARFPNAKLVMDKFTRKYDVYLGETAEDRYSRDVDMISTGSGSPPDAWAEAAFRFRLGQFNF